MNKQWSDLQTLLLSSKAILQTKRFEDANGEPDFAFFAESGLEKELITTLSVATQSVFNLVSPKTVVSDKQAAFIANALIYRYENLSAKTYALFLAKLLTAQYGVFYGEFSTVLFFDYLNKFLEERDAYYKDKKTALEWAYRKFEDAAQHEDEPIAKTYLRFTKNNPTHPKFTLEQYLDSVCEGWQNHQVNLNQLTWEQLSDLVILLESKRNS